MKKIQNNVLAEIINDIRNLRRLTPEMIEIIYTMKDSEKMLIIIEYNIVLQAILSNLGITE